MIRAALLTLALIQSTQAQECAVVRLSLINTHPQQVRVRVLVPGAVDMDHIYGNIGVQLTPYQVAQLETEICEAVEAKYCGDEV